MEKCEKWLFSTKVIESGERAHDVCVRDTVVSRAVTSCPACSAGVKPITEVSKCKEYDNEQFAELILSVWFCFVSELLSQRPPPSLRAGNIALN